MRIKLLFVYPDYNHSPVSSAYVLPVLKKYDIPYDYLDLNQNPNLIEALKDGNYTHIATTGLVLDYARVERIFIEAKDFDETIGTILGGRISACPIHILERMPVDFVVIEDADPTFGILMKAIEAEESDFSQIQSIMYRAGKNLVRTKLGKIRPLVNFVPAWEEVGMDYYMEKFQRNQPKHFPIVAGMGCVGKCSFCAPGSRGFRVRPVDEIIQEMQWAEKRYDISFFSFISDVFISSITDVKKFCKAYKESGIKTPYACSLRADYNLEILDAIADAGCKAVFFGLEQFDDDALKAMGKRLNEKTIETFVKRALDNGIEVLTGAMIGNLGDTTQSLKKTIDFIENSGVVCLYLVPLFIYPGTKMYELGVQQGIIKDEFSYCNQLFNNRRSLEIDQPDYPNLTQMSLDEMRHTYAWGMYQIERIKLKKFRATSVDLDKMTVKCRKCGADITLKDFSLSFAYCPTCVTVNACNFSHILGVTDYSNTLSEKLAKSTGRVVCVGSTEYNKGLMLAAEELGATPEKIVFIGTDINLGYVKEKIDYEDLGKSDLVLIGDVPFREKVHEKVINMGLTAENILDMMPHSYKRHIEFVNTADAVGALQLSTGEDIQWLGEIIASSFIQTHGADTKWVIGPAGVFGINICKGFQNVGANVVGMIDSYQHAEDVGNGVMTIRPTDISTFNADKVFLATPNHALQDALGKIVIKHGGFESSSIYKLKDISESVAFVRENARCLSRREFST